MPPINPIEAELKRDTTSWNAQFYFDNYNDYGRYTSASQVPRHVYTCLSDLVSSVGSLSTVVYSELGTAGKGARLGITILGTDYCEDYDEFLADDTFGGIKQTFYIQVNNVMTATDYYLIRDIGLRLIYILDHRARGLTNNQFMLVNSPGTLDPSAASDNSFYWDTYFKVKWENSQSMNAKEQIHTFTAFYERMF